MSETEEQLEIRSATEYTVEINARKIARDAGLPKMYEDILAKAAVESTREVFLGKGKAEKK